MEGFGSVVVAKETGKIDSAPYLIEKERLK
jgi:hypothetical protein